MKKVLLFHMEGCPYCREARRYLAELQNEFPELGAVQPELIDEQEHADIAEKYDYWYVPTFYVDGRKLHEGACTRQDVEKVLRAALVMQDTLQAN